MSLVTWDPEQANLSACIKSFSASTPEIGHTWCFLDALSDLVQEPNSAASAVTGGSNHSHQHLPKFDLHEFPGRYMNWLNFKNLFTPLAKSQRGLATVRKYLISRPIINEHGTSWRIAIPIKVFLFLLICQLSLVFIRLKIRHFRTQ